MSEREGEGEGVRNGGGNERERIQTEYGNFTLIPIPIWMINAT